MLGTLLEMFFDILPLLELFSKILNSKNKKSSSSTKRNILPTLLPNIMLNKLWNLSFQSSSYYSK